MLAGPGLCDDAGLAHPFGEEHLPDGVVHLVGPGVAEVFSLEPDAGTDLRGEAGGEVERCGAADVLVEERVQLGLEGRIRHGFLVSVGQLVERGHQGLGDISTAVGPVSPGSCFGGLHEARNVAHRSHSCMHRTEPIYRELPPFDPRAYERMLRAVSFLNRWFEPTIEGVENIPVDGGGLIVTNHGHFGMDLPVLLSLVLDGTGRPVRALGDRLVFAAPFFRDWAHAMGALEGEPETAVELLRDDQLVLVYPGGAKEALGDPEDAYRLQWEKSRGFIRTALRAQKPIIPIAGIGNEELYVQVVPQERVRESGVGRLISKLLGDKYVFRSTWGSARSRSPPIFTTSWASHSIFRMARRPPKTKRSSISFTARSATSPKR